MEGTKKMFKKEAGLNPPAPKGKVAPVPPAQGIIVYREGEEEPNAPLTTEQELVELKCWVAELENRLAYLEKTGKPLKTGY